MHAVLDPHVHFWEASTNVDCAKELNGEVLDSESYCGFSIEIDLSALQLTCRLRHSVLSVILGPF